MSPDMPSTLPGDPLFGEIIGKVAAAAADRIDQEWRGMQVVEGFPVRELDYESKARFFVVGDSLSNHCCFGYTVCDRTKPYMIGDAHYEDSRHGLRYETVCECFGEEEAILVCMALNAYRNGAER